jgi:hypothetical protein
MMRREKELQESDGANKRAGSGSFFEPIASASTGDIRFFLNLSALYFNQTH